MIEIPRASVDLTPQDLSGVPSDWIVETKNKEASGLLCPNNLANATLDQLTVWVDPLDGTAEYTQVESSKLVLLLFGAKTQVSSKNFQGLLDHVTVLIGIAVGSEAVAGVIHQPYWNYQVAIYYGT